MRQTIRPIILVLVVATSASAEPFNPYAPTPGWSPPPDIWSQPAPVQPPAPSGPCSPFNPYAGRCDEGTFLVPLATLAPRSVHRPGPPLPDDELVALQRLSASAPDAPREAVPEPTTLVMMGVSLLAVARRWHATRQD